MEMHVYGVGAFYIWCREGLVTTGNSVCFDRLIHAHTSKKGRPERHPAKRLCAPKIRSRREPDAFNKKYHSSLPPVVEGRGSARSNAYGEVGERSRE